MPTKDFNSVIKDPKFWKLSYQSQADVLGEVDDEFKSLSKNAKNEILDKLSPTSEFPVTMEAPKTDIRREAIKTAGGVAGGIAGTSGGPLGTIAGATMGAMGAEALYQVGQHAFGEPGAPKTSEEAAKKMAAAGAWEGIPEAVGFGLGKLGTKILAPFAKNLLPEAAEITNKLKNKIKPVFLPSEATESRTLDVLQNISEGSIFGGGKISEFNLKRESVMEDWADDIIKLFGEKTNPDEMGEMFVQLTEKNNKVFKAAANTLYNNVEELAGDATVKTGTLKKFAESIQETTGRLAGIESTNAGDDLVQAVIDLPDEVTFAEAKELRSRLLSRINEFNVLNKKAPAIGKAKTFIKQIDSEIEKGLGPEALKAWREANGFYKDGQELFNNVMIRRLLKHAEDTGMGPELIGKHIFKPGGITTIRKIKDTMSSEQWKKMQSFYVQDLFKKSLDGEGIISGKKLLNNMFYKPTGMGEQTLKEIFNPTQLKEIKLFGTALDIAQKKQGEGLGKMWIQLSQGTAIAGIGAGVAFDQDIITGSSAVILFGPIVLSKMMLNPMAVKWLTKGIKTPVRSPEVLGILSRLTGFAYRTRTQEAEKQ
uniref:Uncharacterized protein n=1 Tax=viral metagenome TaxID=1070528 RepID=A0A6M3IKM9_9ZZZZ